MAGRETKWRLEDVVDFEALLVGGAEGLELGEGDREEVRAASKGIKRERKKLRTGLRTWLEYRRVDGAVGRRTVEGLRLVGVITGIVAFLAAIGLVRGLLVVEEGRRFFNIWVLVGVTVGFQWLILLGSMVGFFFMRRGNGALSLGQRLMGVLVQRVAGRVDRKLWDSLVERGLGYCSALVWRLARLVQGVGVAFNVGLVAGFLGCLWVLDVDFFWESTIFSLETVERFWGWLALPWAWTGVALMPAMEDQSYDILLKRFVVEGSSGWPFLLIVLVVWGLLPRFLMWGFCWFKMRWALGGLIFQEPRHRELWRRLTGVRHEVVTEGPADGVILVDVGGSGVKTVALREFLLRELRVNPEGRYEAAVLDAGREAEAWQAIRKAPLGVVFLVEGWSLSPKQMNVLYRRVRERHVERPVRFLVLGPVHEGKAGVPEREDFEQWKTYVDGLRDPAAEVVAYRELQTVEDS